MKLNLGSGGHQLSGFINLDVDQGWRFEDGLPFADKTIEAITISHALMYVPLERWPFVFSELYRVLQPGGVLRITEDEAESQLSARYRRPGAVQTGSRMIARYLSDAGFGVLGRRSYTMMVDETQYKDASLIQCFHGDPPDVFHAEGVRAYAS